MPKKAAASKKKAKSKDLEATVVIAIDGDTGKLITHNQIVKRDFHDWGVSAAPALVTTARGRRIAASANKTAFFRCLTGAISKQDFRSSTRSL